MNPLLKVNGPPNAIYHCSKNGWTNEELFLVWLNHFVDHSSPSVDKPVLLVLDNHGSHISLEAYEFCKIKNIVMVSLPPHTSHRTQPLDVVFYGPLKKAYNRECDLFLKNPLNERITVYNIAELFSKAYSGIATVGKGISGFLTTGIYPINPNIFSDEDFPFEGPSDLHPRPSITNLPTSTALRGQESLPSTSRGTSGQESPPSISRGSCSQEILRSTSSALPAQESPQADPDCKISEISPIPKISFTDQKEQGRKQHSQILTSTPMKEKLVEKENKRAKQKEIARKKLPLSKENKAAEKPKPKRKKRKLMPNVRKDDTSSDSDISISSGESSDFSDIVPLPEPLHIGCFVLAKVYGEKKTSSYRVYLAELKEICQEGYMCVFYARVPRTSKFSKTTEESYISLNDIIHKLTSPIYNSSTRFNGTISFAEDLTAFSIF